MGCGDSHGPGGVLGLEAPAELCIFGVGSIGMRARVFPQKALTSVPGDGGWPAVVAVLRQAGVLYHFGCGPFCSPQIWESQPTCSEWEGRVGDWHLGMHHSGSCIVPTTDR